MVNSEIVTLSANAQTVLEERYFVRNEKREIIEDWSAMARRVAYALAAPERSYGLSEEQILSVVESFYNLVYRLDFLPNSPTLANAGTRTGQLSACFVFPVDDDLGDIFNTVRDAVLTHQTGGGTGFSFSRLRPKNDLVNSTKGFSSGPVSFMDVFNKATDTIKQGGMRRGANMGILRIDHPDILDFIDCKQDTEQFKNFNISVAITDAFMYAVEMGLPYNLINPRTKEVTGQLDALTVFRKLVSNAWSTGEPGIVFMDRMNAYCPVPWLGEYEATNPCGEQPLIPYESCNLGSINLENFVKPCHLPAEEDCQPHNIIEWDRLRDVIRVSTHMLDNIIDVNKYVKGVPLIAETSLKTRKIGLGVMGFARMLFKLGISYGSNESYALAEKLMSFIDYHSKLMSVDLAKRRGSFPARIGNEKASNEYFAMICAERQAQPNRHPECDFAGLFALIVEHGIRNSNNTTVAPTGTLSIIADTSGGCEPVFALAFKRYQADKEMHDSDKIFFDVISKYYRADEVGSILREVEENHGSILGLVNGVDEDLSRVFVTAHDLSPTQHVLMQASFQKFTDSSISKTINFSESATVDDVYTAYMQAWQTGCKGITVYRNNSRKFQPLSTNEVKTNVPNVEAQTSSQDQAEAAQKGQTPCPQCGANGFNGCDPCSNCGHVGACSL